MSRTLMSLTCLAALAVGPTIQAQEGKGPSKEGEAGLIAVLQKADAPIKAKADACRELARVGTKEAIAPLAALLGDEKLCHMARYALEPIPDPAVDEALRKALTTLEGRPLVGAIGSVGVRKDVKAVGRLTELLESRDPMVASAAARALGRIGSPEASKAIQGALADAPPACQLAFAEGLFRCADALATQGLRDEALAVYDRLDNDKAPRQVRDGAQKKARILRLVPAKGL